MSFATALSLTLALVVFVLACTMANLLARITRLEAFAKAMTSDVGPNGAVRVTMPDPAPRDPVPDRLRSLVDGHPTARFLFLSADCASCDDAVEAVKRWPEETRRATYLFYRTEPAPEFVAPAAVRVLPQSAEAFTELGVRTTPTFMHVEDGVVVGRSVGSPAPA